MASLGGAASSAFAWSNRQPKPDSQTGDAGGGTAKRQFKLDSQTELVLEVGDAPVRGRLLSGTAEIFGTELPPETWVSIPPRHNLSIFTWHGATIELEGSSKAVVDDETPMVTYVNVHAILVARRARAKTASSDDLSASQGPRVIVVGPTDSGKSSLCRMLLSWACRQGWKPTFVDLDVGQGSITIPGCVAATPIEMPIDESEGIPSEMSIAYFYGHTTPSANADFYKVLVKELAQTLERQFSSNAESRAAGMVINTMGWVEGLGYQLLLHAIESFSANVVLVLDQRSLYRNLKDVMKDKPVDIVKLPKPENAVRRNSTVRQDARRRRIKEYFYGPAHDLSPYSNVVNFSDISVYRVGGSPQTPLSALPIGTDPTRLVSVSISRDLLHLVLAVSYAKEPDQIMSSNVAGFVCVTDVDIQRKKLTYLAPCPGDLPSKILIAGTLTWSES